MNCTQVWASSFLPTAPARKDCAQRQYWLENKSVLLVDYANLEIEKKVCIVAAFKLIGSLSFKLSPSLWLCDEISNLLLRIIQSNKLKSLWTEFVASVLDAVCHSLCCVYFLEGNKFLGVNMLRLLREQLIELVINRQFWLALELKAVYSQFSVFCDIQSR